MTFQLAPFSIYIYITIYFNIHINTTLTKLETQHSISYTFPQKTNK